MSLLVREKTALLIVDVQEGLLPQVERPCELVQSLQLLIKGFQTLGIPIFTVEQYPEGLGSTVAPLRECLGEQQQYLQKTTFSALSDLILKYYLLGLDQMQWVIVGLEAHVCVLQTAKDFLNEDRDVVVLNDAISSRSVFDYSTAIAEMRDEGIRVSCVETILFELLRDSKSPEFKEISQLVRDNPAKTKSCCL